MIDPHYNSVQCRILTPREAAGFKDIDDEMVAENDMAQSNVRIEDSIMHNRERKK